MYIFPSSESCYCYFLFYNFLWSTLCVLIPLVMSETLVPETVKRIRALSPRSLDRISSFSTMSEKDFQTKSAPSPMMSTPTLPLCNAGCETADGSTPICTMQDSDPFASVIARLAGKCIEVEGNIGSGKSTLTNNLFKLALDTAKTSLNDDEFSFVHGEKVNHTFLKMFYENPTTYAFAFQLYMLTTRIFQMDEAYRQSHKEGKLVFLDRGAVGDVLFALHNYNSGNMSEEEMKVYESVTNERLPASLSEKVNAVLFLDVDPEQCWYRMTTVRQREAENGVPPAYLNGIDSVYFHLFIDWLGRRQGGFYDMNIGTPPPIMVARWNNFGCTREVMTQLADLVDGIRSSPEVNFAVELPENVRSSAQYVVSTEEQMESLWKSLKEKDQLFALDNVTPVTNIAIDWSLTHGPAFKRVSMCVLSNCGKIQYFGESTSIPTPKYNRPSTA